MTSSNFKMEVRSGPERRRRWSTAEKLAIIQETYEADATVSIVARRHGIQPNQLFAWRKLASQGALTATAAEEEVVPAFRRCYGSCFIAKDTKSLPRDIGMEPCSRPVRSPQSNGMAEAFVKTFKRDYVSANPTLDAETVIAQLPFWFDHYNDLHPHKALGYQSHREFISSQSQT